MYIAYCFFDLTRFLSLSHATFYGFASGACAQSVRCAMEFYAAWDLADSLKRKQEEDNTLEAGL